MARPTGRIYRVPLQVWDFRSSPSV